MSSDDQWILDSILSTIERLPIKYSRYEVRDMILRDILHSDDEIDEDKKTRLNQYAITYALNICILVK